MWRHDHHWAYLDTNAVHKNLVVRNRCQDKDHKDAARSYWQFCSSLCGKIIRCKKCTSQLHIYVLISMMMMMMMSIDINANGVRMLNSVRQLEVLHAWSWHFTKGNVFSAGSTFEFRLLISVKAWVSKWIAILLSHFHWVLPFQAAPPILVVRMLYQFAHSFYVKHVCTNGIRSWFWVLRRYEIITYSSTWDRVVEIRVGNFEHDFKWTIWFTE